MFKPICKEFVDYLRRPMSHFTVKLVTWTLRPIGPFRSVTASGYSIHSTHRTRKITTQPTEWRQHMERDCEPWPQNRQHRADFYRFSSSIWITQHN